MSAPDPKKIRIALLYGGRSGEHEVSLRSAASVLRHLDPERYEIVPVGIDRQGRWHLNDLQLLKNAGESLPLAHDAPEVLAHANPASGGTAGSLAVLGGRAPVAVGFDVVFPVLHGPLGEDGTVQGLLELADVPYVGCGVLASAVGMDKDVAKRLIRDAGLPMVPYIALKSAAKLTSTLAEQIEREVGYPAFI